MLGNGKNRGVGNILPALLCILLFILFAGLFVWSSKEDAAESKRLQELAKTEKNNASGVQQEDIQTKSPKEDAEEALEDEDAQEESLEEEDTEGDAEEEIPARGIVCWGDDLINGEDSATYSYKVLLQNHLNENGYELPVLDKTIQGGGTLSMMTMAGVPAEEVQSFITAHQEAANGGELYITETGIRDLTPEQLDRSDADCIPVIFMGYYGGWNHDPAELAQQQEKILNTFQNKEKFIVVAAKPIDESVDFTVLDSVMTEKWGEHYISAETVTTDPAASYEGQAQIAEAVFQKLEELAYIAK